jgi:hypothetical protein
MRILTIGEVEQAINYWRERTRSNESYGLCPPARVLADVYGRMIFGHADTVPESELIEDQRAALVAALDSLSCGCKERKSCGHGQRDHELRDCAT